VLAENAVLGLWAAALGLGVAAGLLPSLRALLPPDFPRAHEMILRWPIAAFAAASAVGASLVAGLGAALRYSRADPAEALHEDSRTASGSRGSVRLRGALAAAQMTLACVLCFAAILLLRSSIALGLRDPGFTPTGALTFELAFPANAYDPPRMGAFYREGVRRLREIPGVTAAGFSTSVPWTGYDENSEIAVPGYTPKPGEKRSARYQAASAGYFEALGARIVEGRGIDERDAPGAPRAAVINQALMKHFFADRSPLGRSFQFFGNTWEVVGVMADIQDDPADLAAAPAVYMSLHQIAFARIRGVVRASGDPLAILPAVRSAIASIDPEMPVSGVRTLAAISEAAHSERRFTLWWCAAFAVLALALGAVGIYSLLAFSVQQRQREIAIRLTLGATRLRAFGTLFAGGLVLAAIGIAVGFAASPAAGRVLASLLYGVSTADLPALAAAAGAILAAAVLASLAPAWTASRTNPVSALREQ
jgi:predicted permease